MIDQYKYYENDNFSEGIKNIESTLTIEQKFNDFCEMVKNEVVSYGNRVEFIRKTSVEASKTFEDNSLDAIFVDANHEYKYVLEDLYAWWPKVKSGGIMAGDDYWMEDVKRAVHFFETDKEVIVQFKIKEGTDYKIFYFIKP
jgi:cephalosporin hydroxylase